TRHLRKGQQPPGHPGIDTLLEGSKITMSRAEQVEQVIKTFILDEFLPGEDPNQLEDSTPLISTGILDSIATLNLVSFLESKFNISIAAQEADAEHLNTVSRITALVLAKVGGETESRGRT